jgi:hypothetical protein
MKTLLQILLLSPLFTFGQNTISIDLQSGWNLFGYVCQEPEDVIDALSSYLDFIVIVKDYEGQAYLPEWDYNGIGDLKPGYGYQIKVIENIPDFNLCVWTDGNNADLEAELDSLYTHGCMDPLACNFDINHVYDDFLCSYPIHGYDCEGNISEYVLGMEAEGGIVFYIDETGQHGLVAAKEDIGPFAWGCQDMSISNADAQEIGTGLQNSLDILAQCSETPIASSEALEFENEDYSDWYLPSFDEVQEMYYKIGQGSSIGNKGNFSNSWYWTSSQANTEIAWGFSFNNGTTFNFYKSSAFMIRPVRSF